jgi:HD-GYP domain-containing protein (c-di-GMP phosphodiesterase class II)
MGLAHEEIDKLHLFCMLHDIGKIGISDQILKKPGKLTDEEWEEMKKHPEIGYRIAMSSPDFANVAEFILSHHERWDGKGYPRGLKGESIPNPFADTGGRGRLRRDDAGPRVSQGDFASGSD